MNYIIREIRDDEYTLLNDFLYEAIFSPQGVQAPPRTIINLPELQVYVSDFGKQEAQKANYAVKIYQNVGFEIVDENEEEYIMLWQLR